MSYVSNIKDVSYDHSGTPYNGRFNDLYVDGTFTGPSVTGPTGPTGPAGPAFVDGWSVTLSGDVAVVDPITRIPFDQATNGFLGDFNIGSHAGTIDSTGRYLVTAQVTFTWTDAGPGNGEISLFVLINGAVRGRSTCIYPLTPTSSAQTLVYSRVLSLNAGDSLHTEIAFDGIGVNTIIGGDDSYFSCQRIA